MRNNLPKYIKTFHLNYNIPSREFYATGLIWLLNNAPLLNKLYKLFK